MKEIKFLGNCPICNKKYNSDNASVLEKNQEFMSFYINCEHCLSSVIVAVFFPLSGLVTTIGMLTDVSREDLKKMKKLSPLTADEVLEMHVHMESVGKGFTRERKSKTQRDRK